MRDRKENREKRPRNGAAAAGLPDNGNKKLRGPFLDEKAREILETLDDGYYEVDLRGTFLFCNQAYADLFGLSKEDIIGVNYQHIGGHDVKKTYEIFNTVYRTGLPRHRLEREITLPDGTRKFLETSISLVRDEKGRPIGFRGIVRDVTSRKKTEEELAQWKKRYELIVASSGQVVNEYDPQTGTLLWGGSLEKVLGYHPSEMTGRAGQWIRMLHPDDRRATLRHFERAEKENRPVDIEYRFRHKEGHYIWIRDRGYYLYDEQGKPVRLLTLLQDITDRKRLEEKLRDLGLRDELTGLYNRRGFLTLAEQELKTAKRIKQGVFLLYADLDDLKNINDAYGHQEGDRALAAASKVLQDTFRSPDIIARLGGDEFVVLALEGKDKASEEEIHQRLKSHLKKFNEKKELPYVLSLSVGVVRSDSQNLLDIEQLIAEADKRMYREKAAGKLHPLGGLQQR